VVIKEGYKILYRYRKFLYSLSFVYEDYKIVRYRKDRWVGRPKKCGPLAVFNTKLDVNNFLIDSYNNYNDIKVYRVKYIPSKIDYLYDHINKRFCLPPGTCLAEKIYLLEDING